MNWFQKLITNANVHNVGAGALLLTGLFAPEVLPLAKAAAGAVGLVTTGAMLPGDSILAGTPGTAPTPLPAAPLLNLPPAAAGGSYHTIDYAALGVALLQQIASVQQPSK